MNPQQIIFTGRVQGVGFRQTVANLAHSFPGIAGRIKNMPDGSVQLILQGLLADQADFLQIILKTFEKNIKEYKTNHFSCAPFQDFRIDY